MDHLWRVEIFKVVEGKGRGNEVFSLLAGATSDRNFSSIVVFNLVVEGG